MWGSNFHEEWLNLVISLGTKKKDVAADIEVLEYKSDQFTLIESFTWQNLGLKY